MTRKQKNLTNKNTLEALAELKTLINPSNVVNYNQLTFALQKSSPEATEGFLNLVKELKTKVDLEI
jgi:hypothetical protein